MAEDCVSTTDLLAKIIKELHKSDLKSEGQENKEMGNQAELHLIFSEVFGFHVLDDRFQLVLLIHQV